MTRNFWAHIKHDMSASIVVFLIALPLCLGIALASGAPLLSGIIAGIVGGIVAGVLSSSSYSVSGPAAGLTAIVFSSIHQLGSFEIFLCAVILAGVIQLVLGYLKAGSITAYLPGSVIKGMLTGIGIIIILKQIPHAFGYDADTEGDFTFIEASGNNTLSSLLQPLRHIQIGAILITSISLGIILIWERPFMKRMKVVPGALVAVGSAIALNEIFRFSDSSLFVSGNHLVNLPDVTSAESISSVFVFPDFAKLLTKDIWTVAFTLAAVASVETLLNIEAIDKLDPHKKTTSPNRELKAQGVGNIISGLLGGLPITSVIVRSSANLNAGARSSASAILHGLLLLICVVAIPVVLNKIPLAALAAILLATGYKLTKISIFREMFAKGKYQWVPFVATVLTIVFTDLLTGVITGLVVSALAILRGNMKTSYYFHSKKHNEGEVIHIELAQEISFLNKASIKNTLNHLPENSMVWIDAHNTVYIDHDILELMREFREIKAPDKNIDLYLTGFRDEYEVENSTHVVSEKLLDVKTEMYRNQKPALFI